MNCSTPDFWGPVNKSNLGRNIISNRCILIVAGPDGTLRQGAGLAVEATLMEAASARARAGAAAMLLGLGGYLL